MIWLVGKNMITINMRWSQALDLRKCLRRQGLRNLHLVSLQKLLVLTEAQALKSWHQLKKKNSSDEIKKDLQLMDSLIFKKEPTLVTRLQDHKMERWTKWALKLVFLCQFKLQTSREEREELLLDKQHQPSHQTHNKRSSKLNLLLKIYSHPMADKLDQVEWDLMELLQLKMKSKLRRQCK